MSELSREVHLDSDAFAKMDRLRILEFLGPTNEVHLPSSGLEYLSDELRYLRWDEFPSKSLPQNFDAENLLELHLFESKVEKLWEGVQDIENLRTIDLRGSGFLTELPSLSKAKNLTVLNLCNCKSLIEFPSSLQCLEKLELLDLSGVKVEKLWGGVQDVVNLRRIDLSDCECLTELPDLSKANNLTALYLRNCKSLIELPPSLQCLEKLAVLNLSKCCNLRSLPSRLDSEVLRNLIITGTPHISRCPEIISRNMRNLYLNGTSIKEVPPSITSTLVRLDLSGCSYISKFPEGLRDIAELILSWTAIEEVPSSILSLTRLERLDLSGCSKLESFPEITEPMQSLKYLYLRETGVKVLPSSSIKHLVSLKYLYLSKQVLK